MFSVITIILTRRCSFNCEYCSIANIYTKELPVMEWIRFVDCVVERQKRNVFFLITGGEPLLYKDLSSLVTYLNEKGVGYSIITTGFARNKDRDRVLCAAKGVSTTLEFGTRKGVECYKLLREVSQSDKPYGIVAEVTLTHSNLQGTLLQVARTFSEIPNFKASFAFIETKFGRSYDFSSRNRDLLYGTDWLIVKSFVEAYKERVIFPDSIISFCRMNSTIPRGKALEFCNPVYACTIDADGTFRLCYRIRGKIGVTISDFVHNFDVAYEFWREVIFQEKRKKCRGCYWLCPWFASTVPDMSIV